MPTLVPALADSWLQAVSNLIDDVHMNAPKTLLDLLHKRYGTNNLLDRLKDHKEERIMMARIYYNMGVTPYGTRFYKLPRDYAIKFRDAY
jgi:hypothetical protein